MKDENLLRWTYLLIAGAVSSMIFVACSPLSPEQKKRVEAEARSINQPNATRVDTVNRTGSTTPISVSIDIVGNQDLRYTLIPEGNDSLNVVVSRASHVASTRLVRFARQDNVELFDFARSLLDMSLVMTSTGCGSSNAGAGSPAPNSGVVGTPTLGSSTTTLTYDFDGGQTSQIACPVVGDARYPNLSLENLSALVLNRI